MSGRLWLQRPFARYPELVTEEASVGQLACAGDEVWYSSGREVLRRTVPGGDLSRVTRAEGDVVLLVLGTDGLNKPLFFTVFRRPEIFVVEAPRSRPRVVARLDRPAALAIEGDFVYFTDYDAHTVGRARWRGEGRGSVEVLAARQGHPTGLALGPARVFWSAEGGGRVAAVPKEGGAVTELAQGFRNHDSLRYDHDAVFFVDWGEAGHRLLRLPLDAGGPVEALVTGLEEPTSMSAARGGGVFLVNKGAGEIVRWEP